MSEEIKDIMDALENNEFKNDGFWGRACSRLSQQLQACKEENEMLNLNIDVLVIDRDCFEKSSEAWRDEADKLHIQNKQMREAINNIKNLCNEDWEDMTVDKFQNQLLQALKGVK